MFFGSSPWRLATLADFWNVIKWMEQQRVKGNGPEAMRTFYRHITKVMRTGVDTYRAHVAKVDSLCGGLFTAPGGAKKAGLKSPAGADASLVDNLNHFYNDVQPWLVGLEKMSDDERFAAWEAIAGDRMGHVQKLSLVVQDYGNFEPLVMTLPGVGDIPTNPKVQAALVEMYRINTRHIRIFELVRSYHRAWHANPQESTIGFFKPATDLGQLCQKMLIEYMIESDPRRIEVDKRKAKKAGRPYQKYRFWRPAETFRQLSGVTYEEVGQKRRPRPTRRYVDVKAEKLPPITPDLQRLEWTLKEVFNNAVAATSHMTVDDTTGRMEISPLHKHAQGNGAAISLKVEGFIKKSWFSKKQMARLVIADSGIGMCGELAQNAPLWAYSTRRAGVDHKLEPIPKDSGHHDLIIGGKGIGLAFATATLRELGGDLYVRSTLDHGTEVVMELPVPTPFAK